METVQLEQIANNLIAKLEPTWFKHTCHYERIGVYFKETESISTDLVVVYVIEV